MLVVFERNICCFKFAPSLDIDLAVRINEDVIGFVPSDYQTAVGSINLGTPLVLSDASSKIAQEIRRISENIAVGVAPIEDKQPRQTLWKSLFKREVKQQLNLETSLEKV